ncbi:MAG: DUF86 domain-containing protein [Deltaproteobacteria bacterium]|nr:DUF86 domain-containing protein [Deltaproteobacteria bacterium]
MIDPAMVHRKLSLITTDLKRLKDLVARTREALLSDEIGLAAAERYLERVIGRMIDINYHLITSEGEPPPKDYYLSFVQLSIKPAILDKQFAEEIANAAGLRNRIVHEYDDIDPGLTIEGMRAAVRDIPLYAGAVLKYLEKRRKDRDPAE